VSVERYPTEPTKILHSYFVQSLRATVSLFSNALEIFGSGCFGISIYCIFSQKGTILAYDHILSQHTFHIMALSTQVWQFLFLYFSDKNDMFCCEGVLLPFRKHSIAKKFFRLHENTTWKSTLYFNKMILFSKTDFFCTQVHVSMYSSLQMCIILDFAVKRHVASILVWRKVHHVVATYYNILQQN
jgi:hypothetical protein